MTTKTNPRSRQTTPRRRTASNQVAPALLDAAEVVLDRDGQRGVTIRTVAREAGVAPMSVYNRFASHEGLLIALAVRAFAMLAEALTTPADLTPEQRFRQVCWGYRSFALQHPARYALIFSVGSPVTLPAAQEASEQGREAFGCLVEAVGALSPPRRRSRANADATTENAQIVWNALHGAVTIESADIGRTATPVDTYEHMITVLLRGIRKAD